MFMNMSLKEYNKREATTSRKETFDMVDNGVNIQDAAQLVPACQIVDIGTEHFVGIECHSSSEISTRIISLFTSGELLG